MGVHLADLLTREVTMGESAAARRAREAAEAEAAPAPSTAPEADPAPSSTDPAAGTPGTDPAVSGADSGTPAEKLLWRATSALPNPAGGVHRAGDIFEATEDDPRAKSSFSKRHHDDGDPAPDEVRQALDAPGE